MHFLSSSLLSKNIKFKIYRTIMFAVLYGCETWSFTLRDECRLRVFEKRVLRRIFWPKRDEVTREWRKLHNEELNDCTPHQILVVDQIEKSESGGACSTYGGKGEVHEGFWWGSLREGDHSEDPGVDERIILRCIFKKWYRETCTGLILFRIGTGGGLL